VARKTTILLEDDLTGEVLEEGRGETVTFALDGQSYEIDLSGENSAQLRADLRRYVDAGPEGQRAPGWWIGPPVGRRWSGGAGSPGHWRDPHVGQGARPKVSGRGRIPSSVVEAYDAAH
jgi:hypothetical protein